MGLLSRFKESRIEAFYKDIYSIFRSVFEIDLEYSRARAGFEKDLKLLKKIILLWNRKYRNVSIKYCEQGMQIQPIVTIKKTLPEVAIAAKGIDGLAAINKKAAWEDVLIEDNMEQVELLYKSQEENENTLNLEKQNSYTKLLYSQKEIILKESPEFKILAYFALLGEISYEIDLQKFSSDFSFDTEEEAEEGRGISYQDRVRLFDKA